VTTDVTRLEPSGLPADLARRDFTINALALDLRDAELHDPTAGQDDLRAGLVRAIADAAFGDDPARLVRAYRLSAELGFAIEDGTRALLRRDRHLLASSPPQRWGKEMLLLCAADGPVAPTLGLMDEDRVLDEALPGWADLRGVAQGPYHHRDALGHTLEALAAADRLLADPGILYPSSADALAGQARRPSFRAAVRAAVLLHDIGKPAARTTDEAGRILFRGHGALGAETASRLVRRWGWPKAVRSAVETVVRLHMRQIHPVPDAGSKARHAWDTAVRRLSRDAGPAFLALFVVGAADFLAARGPAAEPAQALVGELDSMLARALELRRAEVAAPRLVTGRDLMALLGIGPGPRLGAILRAIEAARQEGRLATREEALAMARELHEGDAGRPGDG
jgi:putative nucleotidyltransferase with HDIG domain